MLWHSTVYQIRYMLVGVYIYVPVLRSKGLPPEWSFPNNKCHIFDMHADLTYNTPEGCQHSKMKRSCLTSSVRTANMPGEQPLCTIILLHTYKAISCICGTHAMLPWRRVIFPVCVKYMHMHSVGWIHGYSALGHRKKCAITVCSMENCHPLPSNSQH